MFQADNEPAQLPAWLIETVAADPDAAAEILLQMRDHWPADFIKLLKRRPIIFSTQIRSPSSSLPSSLDSEHN